MTLIDFPRPVSAEEYEIAVERVVEALATVQGVRSVYQIGHVSTLGISDIDLLVLFAPSARNRRDPRSELGPTGRYLFVHGLFGVTEDDFAEARKVSFFHNYHLRWGEPAAGSEAPSLDPADESLLKRQVALEYMIRIYIGLFVELTYGIIKVRNLLLHAKALLYDCEFLGIQDGAFRAAAKRLVDRRSGWFSDPAPARGLPTDAAQLCRSLGETLNALFTEHQFYLPVGREGGSLARHITVRRGTVFSVHHRGPTLPGTLARVSKKYVNLLHRVNRFEVALPFSTQPLPPIVQRTFDLRKRLSTANRRVCPHFMPLSTGFILQ